MIPQDGQASKAMTRRFRTTAATAVAAMLAIWAVLAWKMLDRVRHEDDLAQFTLSRQASAMAASIERALELAERDLSDLAGVIPEDRLGKVLRSRLLRSPYLGNLLHYDAAGRLDGYGGFEQPPQQLRQAPDWFDPSRADTVLGVLDGRTAMARPLYDGSGFVAAILAPDVATDLPPPDSLPRDVSVALITVDGMIIAGRTENGSVAGLSADTLPALAGVPLYGFAAQGRRVIADDEHRAVMLQLRSRPLRLLLAAPAATWPPGLRMEAVQASFAALAAALAAAAIIWMQRRAVMRESALASKLEQMFQAVEQIPASFVLTDEKARIQYVNPAFQQNTGYRLDEVIGQNPRIVQSGRTPEAVYKKLWSDLTQGRAWRGQMLNKRKDGAAFWEESVITPLRDLQGRITSYAAFKTDISEFKTIQTQLSEMSQQFQATFEQAAVGIAHVAPDGSWLRVNSKLCEILGYERDDLETMNFREITHPEDMDESLAKFQSLLDGEIDSYESDKRYLRADGATAWTRLTVSAVRSGGAAAYAIAVIQDIGEHKRIEEEMAQMQRTLRNSNENLQQFAYVASHDLQEPLRMISSYLQLLERRVGPDLNDEAKEFIAFAVDGAKRMSRLIQDLLTYARVESKGRAFVEVDLNTVCADAVANLHIAASDCGADIVVGDLPTIRADDMQMLSLFQNLIGNALKYRTPDRKPEVRITAQNFPGRCEISVADNGIGIAPEHFDRIFAVFQRLHGRGEYEGTGIGLAVCKKIVERHGGSIWVKSDGESGSEFIFSLPVLT